MKTFEHLLLGKKLAKRSAVGVSQELFLPWKIFSIQIHTPLYCILQCYIHFICELVLSILLSLNKSKQDSKVLLYIAVEPPKQSGYKLAITCRDLQQVFLERPMIINNILIRNKPILNPAYTRLRHKKPVLFFFFFSKP